MDDSIPRLFHTEAFEYPLGASTPVTSDDEGEKKRFSTLNPDAGIGDESRGIIKANKWPLPSEAFNLKDDKIRTLMKEVGKKISDNEKYDAEHLTKKGEIRAKVDSKTRSVVAKHQSQRPILMDYHKRLQHVQTAEAYKQGSGIRYFYNPRTLVDRLELLGGSIMAGNGSAKNEFYEIPHVLRRLGLIKDDALRDLLQGYVFR